MRRDERLTRAQVPTLPLPTLFISGDQDELVPPEHMRLLFALSPAENKRLHTVRGGGHNDAFVKGGVKYMSAIREFLDDVVPARQ